MGGVDALMIGRYVQGTCFKQVLGTGECFCYTYRRKLGGLDIQVIECQALVKTICGDIVDVTAQRDGGELAALLEASFRDDFYLVGYSDGLYG